ncbi:trypsin-2 [Orussus abietinus]|uniref:trypsin-2 n=1 Tax=Orussus abietinus TaxID=222816 RepID=UPI000626DE84|nr:trypsin-2 [Orussus abietinus]
MFRILILPLLGVASFGFVPRIRPSMPDGRIVGGKEATIEDHPYQLSFQIFNSHICGASIISSKWAVTAGHCVNLSPQYYQVSAGNKDRSNGTLYDIRRIIRHPQYNVAAIDYDIALLEIDGEINLGRNVQPLKLGDKEPPAGRLVNITGWGALSQGGLSTRDLMKVTVPIVEHTICERAYKFVNNITSRMICAGYYDKGGKDACQGDSGGPLVANNTLYGIVSWGLGCAKPRYPGVYSNVANLRPWIKEITGV